jgi:hypothetical protein
LRGGAVWGDFLSKDWQTKTFEEQFDNFAKQVALKARPK